MTQTALTTLDSVRDLAGRGEQALASIEAIRLLSACASDMEAADETIRRSHSELLSDLGALRFAAGDPRTARTCLAASLLRDPENDLAAENLAAVESCLQSEDGPQPAEPLDPLADVRTRVLDSDATVLQVGDRPVPAGATAWTSVGLSSDLGAVPASASSIDVALVELTPEAAGQLETVLSELHRVLTPGGTAHLAIAPLWTSAGGHRVGELAAREGIDARDALLPDWAHLLLEEKQVSCFLLLALGASHAAAVARAVRRAQGATEAEWQRALDRSLLESEGLRPIGESRAVPPGIRQALDAAGTLEGDFGVDGLHAVLSKRG